MTGTAGGVVTMLTILGRFLYRLLLAVTIVWVLGLLLSLVIGDGPGGGVSVNP